MGSKPPSGQASIDRADVHRAILHAAMDGFWVTDSEGHFLEVNPAYCRMSGYAEQELLGMRILDVEAAETAAETIARMQKVRTQGSDRFESSHRRKDGSIYPVEVSTLHISGNTDRYVVFVRDITAHREAERKLKDEQLRLQNIIEGENVGTWEWNIQTGEVVVNSKWAQIVGYTLSELSPISIRTWEALCHPDDLKESTILLEQHFAGKLPHYICECRMRHKDGHWIWIHDRGSVTSWSPDGRPLMMFGTHTDVTKRKQFEQALSKSETRLREVLENSRVASYKRDLNTNQYEYISPVITRLTGYTSEEMASLPTETVFEFVHPDDLGDVKRVLAESMSENIRVAHQIEYRFKRKDGQERWLLDQFSVLRDNAGQNSAIVGSVSDVTDRKLIDGALRESIAQYQLLFEFGSDALFLIDTKTGMILDTNLAASELYGYSRDEMRTRRSTDMSAEPEETSRRTHEAQTYDDSVVHIPYRLHRKKDGTVFPVEITARSFPMQDKRVLIVAVRDISDRTKAERALRESEERFRLIAETIDEVFWMADVEIANTLYVSPAFQRVWGRSPQSLYGNPRSFLDAIHSEDRERVIATFAASKKLRQTFNVEYRIILPDGGIRHIWDRGFPIRDENGHVFMYAGVGTDVTERKAAEGALRESNGRYLALLNNDRAAIGIFDAETMRIVDVNKAHSKLYGYSREDLVGLSIFELSAEREESIRSVQGFFEKASFYFPLRWHRKKDGTVFPVEIVGGGYEWQGRRMMFAMVLDISERIENEEKLRRLQKAESLERMAGAIAHHFNNQLATVMGNLDMATAYLPTGAQAVDNLTAAMEAARRAAAVSGLMLTYLGKSKAAFDLVNLSETCQNHLPLIQTSLTGGIAIEATLPSPGPSIRGSANQICQALTNLIANAVEAVEHNQGSIRVTVKSVGPADIPSRHRYPSDWQARTATYGCLEVADTGSGMDQGIVEKLFEPFFSTKFTGRGLRLPVVLRNHAGSTAE